MNPLSLFGQRQTIAIGFYFPRPPSIYISFSFSSSCGNVAAILEIDEQHHKTFKTFEASPEQENRSTSVKRVVREYFL
jgi:hypothetical protein